MPIQKRFWEKAETAPIHLDHYPRDAAHWTHHSFYSLAPEILREGMFSPSFAERVRKPLPILDTTSQHEVSTWKINFPLENYEEDVKYGKVRFLLSKGTPIPDDHRLVSGNAKYRIAPRYITAIIIPKNSEAAEEYDKIFPRTSYRNRENYNEPTDVQLARIIQAARKEGIPVYSTEGNRLWPPVGLWTKLRRYAANILSKKK